MVNDQVVTVAEILYTLREQERQGGGEGAATGSGARANSNGGAAQTVDEARRRIIPKVQQAVGTLLLYQKATAKINDSARQAIAKAIDQQIKRRASIEFNDSVARFEEHLADHGLNLKQFRDSLERQLVARDYVREVIAPQINVNRDELLAAFEQRRRAGGGPETRELMIIEAPFAAFLPAGAATERATAGQISTAAAEAERHVKAAHAQLGQQSFASVAAKYDRGPQRAKGGSWGMIGKPLRPPYDDLSRRIFQFREGQCSDPIRTPQGWYIVRCGVVRGGALKGSFEEVQAQLREEMLDQRFAEYTSKYLVSLAERSSMSSVEEFVELAVRRFVQRGMEQAARPRTAATVGAM